MLQMQVWDVSKILQMQVSEVFKILQIQVWYPKYEDARGGKMQVPKYYRCKFVRYPKIQNIAGSNV